MPILNVKLSGQPNAVMTRKVCEVLTNLTVHVLGKKRELISINVDYTNSDSWFVGGELLSKQGKNSFYLEIKITDETNTKQEKAKYIEDVYHALEAIMANLHDASYVHVEDVRATAYGYGGKTQEYRFHK